MKVKFGTATHRSEALLDCVHVDVCGPTKIASLGGHLYFIFFVDELSRCCWVCTMKQKFEDLNMLVK